MESPVPVMSSEKLVLEQHSLTLAHFCCPRPPLGLVPVLVLNSEKLVLEQPCLTVAHFCCPRPPPLGLLPVLPVLKSEKLVWEQHSFTFAAAAEFREASFGATLFHFC